MPPDRIVRDADGLLAQRQAAAGTIRVLDLIILLKDENEECWRIEVSDLPPEQAAAVDFIET